MAEKSEEILVEIDPPATELKADVEIAVPGSEKTIVTPEQGIEELKKQLDDERRARFEAQERAQQAQNQANSAKNETDDTNLRMIGQAIAVVRNNQTILEQNYAAAMTSSDYAAAAKVQNQMAKAAVELADLERGEKSYKEQQKRPIQTVQRPQADPVEAFASQLTPRSADWVRAHPEYARDQRLTRKMVRAHEDAIDDGIAPDTDEYFRSVEGRLGLSDTPRQETQAEISSRQTVPAVQQRSSPASAPVSRSGGSVNGSRATSVRLTASEREIAVMVNPDLSAAEAEREYAKNKLALINEGKLH